MDPTTYQAQPQPMPPTGLAPPSQPQAYAQATMTTPTAVTVPVQSSPVSFQPAEPTVTDEDLGRAKSITSALNIAVESRLVGQAGLRRSLLIALLCNGHILMESVPGLAKTTAAATLAQAIRATFHRIQCTPDLLPSDIMGTQLYDQQKSEFRTQLGPVNANFVLLDEINRSSAKTQSAMLEAMQERQVSIGGVVYPLPKPFLVLATQNPIEQEGTYELPEAQLDRFLIKEVLTYPSTEEEVEILKRINTGVYQSPVEPINVSTDDIVWLQRLTDAVYIDESVMRYIVQIVEATRTPSAVIGSQLARYVDYGASPRAAISFMQAARASAVLEGRAYVIPDDVKALRHSILRHRIILNFEAIADSVHQEAIIDAIFAATATP